MMKVERAVYGSPLPVTGKNLDETVTFGKLKNRKR